MSAVMVRPHTIREAQQSVCDELHSVNVWEQKEATGLNEKCYGEISEEDRLFCLKKEKKNICICK